MAKLTHVRWVGPNDPTIRIIRNDARLYLTKRELVDLMKEIEEFVNYYREDFTSDRIDNETSTEEYIQYSENYNE
jgi:hypothetical protein